jgi:hypothetical protein
VLRILVIAVCGFFRSTYGSVTLQEFMAEARPEAGKSDNVIPESQTRNRESFIFKVGTKLLDLRALSSSVDPRKAN